MNFGLDLMISKSILLTNSMQLCHHIQLKIWVILLSANASLISDALQTIEVSLFDVARPKSTINQFFLNQPLAFKTVSWDKIEIGLDGAITLNFILII